MEAGFWHQRWQQNLIGFHQSEVNRWLVKFQTQLATDSATAVFVPLCGKTQDLLWLRDRGHAVTGVELSPVAVQDFFRDNGLQPDQLAEGDFKTCSVPGLRILCGDFFGLPTGQLADVGAVYDRAALIALPPPMRPRYVDKLTSLLKPGTRMLLITMEYPQSQMDGPPFAVEEDEVLRLFSPNWSVEVLDREDILVREPRFSERGLTRLDEKVYLLIRS